MQGSGVIVAINKDPHAPIFEYADLGVVGDLQRDRPEADRARPRAQGRDPAGRLPAAAGRGGRSRRRRTPIRSRSACSSSVPARPGSRRRSGSASSRPTRPRRGSARCRSRCSRRARRPGSHLLSGAVVNPGPLRRLLGDDDFPSYGEVPGEAVYFLTRERARADPDAADDAQQGQRRRVALAARPLARASGRRRLGAMMLPETAAQRLLVEDGRVVGVRTGDKGRGRDGEELRALRAGLGHPRARDDPRRGDAGPSDAAPRSSTSGSRGANPQVWALGVKEVWKVREAAAARDPHAGLAAARRARGTASSAARSSTRWATSMVSLGMVVGLDYARLRALGARPAAGAEDAPARARDPRRRRARRVGREDDSRGRVRSRCRARCTRRGCCSAVTASGFVNVPALKGIHYAVESGRLAAEAAWGSLAGGELGAYDDGASRLVRLARPARGAEHAAGVRARAVARRRDGGR